jgi:hypothetical protein
MRTSDRAIREVLAGVIESRAVSLLDPDRLQAIAEDLRVVERRRGYDVGLVAVSLILSALQRSTDTQGRLVDARRVYEMLGGGATRESGFRKVARKVVPVLREVLRRRLGMLAETASTPALQGRLASLRDVLIPDGCAFKLANKLAGAYAGTGQESELKLHAVYSVRAGGVVSLEATEGSVHDNDGFAPQWQPGALYIWDLGFNDYERVVKATTAGALVLQRLKSGANPRVLASYGPTGQKRDLSIEEGRPVKLEDACAVGLVHHQRVLDLDVELREGGQTAVVRVVCVPFGGEDRYYLTTLPREAFSPHDVAELYRLRWEIELFFRGLKGAVRLDEVRRLENDDSMQVVVYATLLAAMLSADITAKLNELEANEMARLNAEAPDVADEKTEPSSLAPCPAVATSSEAFPPGAFRVLSNALENVARRSAEPSSRQAQPGSTQQGRLDDASPADLLRRRLAARASVPPRPAARYIDRVG